MADGRSWLTTVGTVVAIAGGLVGLYKAFQPSEDVAFVIATSGEIKFEEFSKTPVLTVTFTNRGKHDAINLQAEMPSSNFTSATHTANSLGPAEATEFSWWVMKPQAAPKLKGNLGIAQYRGTIAWTDRLTRKTEKSDWCFSVAEFLGRPFNQKAEACETENHGSK
jgi:hypothetical protein